MESKPAAKDPLYSDNYKVDDWSWGVSLGEGKNHYIFSLKIESSDKSDLDIGVSYDRALYTFQCYLD